MYKIKVLALGGLLAVFTAIFQIIPAVFSEALAVLTVLSALPLFIISRINPKVGLLSFFTSFILIMLFSIHEAFFFIFTNGIIGLSLGTIQHLLGKKIIVPFISSFVLAVSLCVMTFIFGISIFGADLLLPAAFLLCIFIVFSLIYCIIYFYISNIVFNIVIRNFKLWNDEK